MHTELIDDGWDIEEAASPKTVISDDLTKTILSSNDSPDVGFHFSVNPYRGCEHGCIYCYARPTHEYLGLSSGLDFETKLFVKREAPKLLSEALMKKSWKPEPIILSGVTDCYQPIERHLKVTRGCLEVLREFRNPVVIVTKSALVTRDIDILKDLAKDDAALVIVSVTSLDKELARTLEPRASSPNRRIWAISELSKAGIPVSVNVAPVIPGLTDHEIPEILKAAAEAGARSAWFTMVRLPHAVAPLFEAWLEHHYPQKKSKVLSRIKEMRGGQLNESNFGSRMRGQGEYAKQIEALFNLARKKCGLDRRDFELSSAAFQRPDRSPQLALF